MVTAREIGRDATPHRGLAIADRGQHPAGVPPTTSGGTPRPHPCLRFPQPDDLPAPPSCTPAEPAPIPAIVCPARRPSGHRRPAPRGPRQPQVRRRWSRTRWRTGRRSGPSCDELVVGADLDQAAVGDHGDPVGPLGGATGGGRSTITVRPSMRRSMACSTSTSVPGSRTRWPRRGPAAAGSTRAARASDTSCFSPALTAASPARAPRCRARRGSAANRSSMPRSAAAASSTSSSVASPAAHPHVVADRCRRTGSPPGARRRSGRRSERERGVAQVDPAEA